MTLEELAKQNSTYARLDKAPIRGLCSCTGVKALLAAM